MKVTKEGKTLKIEIDLEDQGKVSSTEKTLIYASKAEKPEGMLIDGRQLTVSVNAYTKNPDFKKVKA